MKKLIVTALLVVTFSNATNAQFGGFLNKAKDATTSKVKEKVAEKTNKAASKLASGQNPIASLSKSVASTNTKGMEGKWKVEGIICNTNNEALKAQLGAQEEQYNAEYKGYEWIFKKEGSIDITSKAGQGKGKYELAGDKINMEINGMPSEFILKFEDGQMFLIQETPLNTVYYVFIKA